ncbi:Ig-like domain-containing protein [Paenibacillus pasadenensis]|uniref:Ig-like domain-containing protein n=1 Tax=Paenibacillus pasadenensis TaxID=217090 RepID=UPI002040DE87|nr:Ig-like domain-containing protein [Paenibacillus pasadenensis]MCM3747562.1 Ig-like domain-containing protein [Paenibacillus pasadenensis]
MRVWFKYVLALLLLLNAVIPAVGLTGNIANAAQGGPVIAGKYPADNADAAPANARLAITFDEPVVKGSGNAAISIRKVADNSEWARFTVSSDSRVQIDPSNAALVTIQPERSFEAGQAYYVLIDAGSFNSTSGSGSFAGINSATDWNFAAADPDNTSPYPTEYGPQGGDASVFSSLRIKFSEPVYPATGTLQLTNETSGDSVPVNITSQLVTGGGSGVITIAPPNGLLPGQSYRVSGPSGLLQDASGNRTGELSWSFQTGASPIGIAGLQPHKGAQGVGVTIPLEITFDKAVSSGSKSANPKYVYLKKVSDNSTVRRWDAADLSYNGNKVTLPYEALAGSTSYYVLVDAGAFRSGELWFAGISDASAWSFSTQAVSDNRGPAVTAFAPANGGAIGTANGKLNITFDRPVYPGTGSIVVRAASNQSILASIAITSEQISGFGSSVLTIDPRLSFQEGAVYYVEIGSQAIMDAAGSRFTGISGSSVWSFTATRDGAPPSLVTLSPATGSTSISTLSSFQAVFTEPVRLADSPRIILHKTGSSDTYAVKAYVPGDQPNTVIIKPESPLPGNTSFYMEIGVGSIRDGAGNAFGGILNEYEWRFTTLRSSTAAPALDKVAMISSTKLLLTYDNELDPASVPYPASFYVTVNDASAAREISQVSVSGNTVTLNLRSGILNGQKVTAAYTAPADATSSNAIRGLGGARAAGFSGRQAVYDAEAAQLKLTGGTVSGNQLKLQFSEMLDAAKSDWTSQFALYVNGSYYSLYEPAVNGNTLTFKLSYAAGGDGGAYVNYTPGTNPVMDRSGNPLAAFSNAYIQNLLDTSKPILNSITASGNKVTLNYNEGLNGSLLPLRSQFSVMTSNNSMSITNVSVEGSKLILQLASNLTTSSTVKVSYVKGVPALADLAGNAADAFSGREAGVTGSMPLFVSGSVNGSVMTLLYSMPLDPSAVPSAGQFSVRANGLLIPVNGVSLSGTNVTLQLSTAVTLGQAVTLTYSPPSYNPLRLAGGDPAAALSSVVITNATYGSGGGGAGGGGSSATPGQLTEYDVTISQDVSPAGRVASRYTILNEKLAAAYQAARNAGLSKVSYKVPETNKAGIVAVPLAQLQQALASANQASFELQYDNITVEIPLQAIDYDKTASQLNAGGVTGYLLLSVDTSASSLAGSLQFTMNRANASLLAGPISIDVGLVGSSGGNRIAYTGLKRYLTTTIQSASPIPAAAAAGVFLDAETSSISYTPTKVEASGSGSKITLKHREGGVYAIVRGSAVLSDVNGHWAKNDINALTAKQITRPRSNSMFEPKRSITRAEFAEFISRGLGLKGYNQGNSAYRDTAGMGASGAYIGSASAAGIVEGSNGLFKPNAPITRQEMATMIIRAVESTGAKITLPQQEQTYLSKFKDRGSISGWAKPYAAKAVYTGVLSGQKADVFGPSANATRAEAVVMIKRMLLYLNMIDM